MSTQLHNVDQESGPVPTQAGPTCDAKTCRTGICSPCIVVWGLVALLLVIIALKEAFQ